MKIAWTEDAWEEYTDLKMMNLLYDELVIYSCARHYKNV